MPDTSESSVRRLLEMLPDYACGVIWLVDVSLGVAFSITNREATSAAVNVAAIIRPFHVPDIAVGFLLAIAGVMVPYSLARALNPVVVVVLNGIRDRWYRGRHDETVSEDHLKRLDDTLARLKLPAPNHSFHLALMPYLTHRRSATAQMLAARSRNFHEQAYLAFPVSILVGLLVFAAFPSHSAIAFVVALVATLAALALTIHRAQMALIRWYAEVLFAFLVVTDLPDVAMPERSPND